MCEAAATRVGRPWLAAGVLGRGRGAGVRRGRLRGRHDRSGSPRSRSRSRRRSRSSCSTSRPRPGSGPPTCAIRHLLSHTSGYDCECGDLAASARRRRARARRRRAARRPPVLGVEQAWSYANTGYWLAGRLAAERAGATFEDAMRAHARAARASRRRVRRAGARRARGRRPRPRRRTRGARRPSGGLSRPSPTCSASAQLAARPQPRIGAAARAARRSRSAASTGSAWSASGSAASRSGATTARSAASSRRCCSSRSAGGVRRADEQLARQQRAPRARGRCLRARARRAAAAVRRRSSSRRRSLDVVRRHVRERDGAARRRDAQRSGLVRARYRGRPTFAGAARSASGRSRSREGDAVGRPVRLPARGLRPRSASRLAERVDVIAGVAAGHPATAAAGAEILAAGGTAADAAVRRALASCVAETVMTGLLGGGHAIYFDAATGAVRNLDCFCAVPVRRAARRWSRCSRSGSATSSCTTRSAPRRARCPGVPAGLDALWRAHGRLPWADARRAGAAARARRRRACRRRTRRASRCSSR